MQTFKSSKRKAAFDRARVADKRFARPEPAANFAPVNDLAAASAAIPARSERQAMDWSLVLASQGIECALEHDAAAGIWMLRIPPAEEARAYEAIRQFRRENRGRPWHHAVPGSDLWFHGGVVFWAIALALVHTFQPWLANGIFSYARADQGEWWRAFTAVWLHKDVAHLASNAVMGLLLLGLTMARYGAGLTLLATLFAGAGANGFALWARQADAQFSQLRGLGASGMVMAALGMLAVQSLPLWRTGRQGTRLVLGGLAAGTLLFVLTGTDPDSDVLAHAVGFAVGAILGGLAALLSERWREPVNRAAGLLFAALVAVTWGLALVR